jgi:coenzyme F420-reducing hydrogenase delta subunit
LALAAGDGDDITYPAGPVVGVEQCSYDPLARRAAAQCDADFNPVLVLRVVEDAASALAILGWYGAEKIQRVFAHIQGSS